MCRPLTSLRRKGEGMQWSSALRQEGMVLRGWAAGFPFLLHYQKDQTGLQPEGPGESQAQQPRQACSFHMPCHVRGLIECYTHCISPCSDFSRQGGERHPMPRKRKEKFIIFVWTVSRALAKLPSRSPESIPTSIISLWRRPASGGLVQSGRYCTSTHKNAEFSCPLHHLPAPFHLRTPCSRGYNKLSDWVVYWL